MKPRIHVVSTGFKAPTRQRCLDSVASQRGVHPLHIYVEASNQNPPLSCMQNTIDAISLISPHDVVCLLDGDDHLAHDRALETVAVVYERHPETLVTWGSYINADGRPGCAAPWPERAPGKPSTPRKAPWVFTHLKTFRAGLFQRIKPEHLKREHARDHSQMFPMLEMAGHDRARFIPEILCVYNYGSSFEFRASPEELAEERAAVAAIRAMKPYDRIEGL